MDHRALSDWVQNRLTNLLNFPVPDEMIKMLMDYDKQEDLENHLCTLLDVGNEKHYKFMNEFLQKKLKVSSSKSKNKGPQVEIASNNSKNFSSQQQKQSKQNQSKAKQQKQQQPQQKIQQPQQKQQSLQNQQTQSIGDKGKKGNKKNESEKVQQHVESVKESESSSGKKKRKVINLYSSDGKEKVILLKGRHKCDCQASKHKLINNCLQCGRIVCEQEGSGPCFFCASLVCSKGEKNTLNAHTKQSDLLLQKLLDQKMYEPNKSNDLDKALEQRNKLLEFDKTSEKRTVVIDDESDYYSVNSVWLSEDERIKLRKREEEARARKHRSAREKRYVIDFAGRQVRELEEEDEIYDINDESTMDALSQKLTHSLHFNDNEERFSESLAIQPKFQENLISNFCTSQSNANVNVIDFIKIQDKEYLEISDMGFCLSMHQPYASLLVSGIKKHEGRNWYTHHRGRLWIAAGAKVPSENEIQRCENFYRNLLGENTLFPSSYPTGCLLGCVNVTDCITQEEYEVQFPNGESDSPFVFICRDPVVLPLKFLVSGKHKIYRLDSKIHQAALKALEKVVVF